MKNLTVYYSACHGNYKMHHIYIYKTRLYISTPSRARCIASQKVHCKFFFFRRTYYIYNIEIAQENMSRRLHPRSWGIPGVYVYTYTHPPVYTYIIGYNAKIELCSRQYILYNSLRVTQERERERERIYTIHLPLSKLGYVIFDFVAESFLPPRSSWILIVLLMMSMMIVLMVLSETHRRGRHSHAARNFLLATYLAR